MKMFADGFFDYLTNIVRALMLTNNTNVKMDRDKTNKMISNQNLSWCRRCLYDRTAWNQHQSACMKS